MAENVLYVTLLGRFSLRRSTPEQDFELTEQDSTSKRLWTFLQYLAVFHQRGVSQEELIDVLWGDGDSSNPTNTLKTLLHRSRGAVEKLGYPDGKQVLLYRRGTYTWNPDILLELDIERFDQMCDQAGDGSEAQRLDTALRAIDLYRGDFLPNAAGNPWAVSLRTYYHNKYIKLCYDTAHTLLEQERYDEAVRICQGATMVDPYDEDAHILLMQALSASGAQPAAIQHYTYVTNMLMDQLGVAPSEAMTQLYRELTKADMSIELDLNVIRDKLLETRQQSGAFFCEYGVFQDIYRLEARSAIRSGRIVDKRSDNISETVFPRAFLFLAPVNHQRINLICNGCIHKCRNIVFRIHELLVNPVL